MYGIIVTARQGWYRVYGEVYCSFAEVAAQCRVPLSGTIAFWLVIIAINRHTSINFSSILADIIIVFDRCMPVFWRILVKFYYSFRPFGCTIMFTHIGRTIYYFILSLIDT